MATAVAQPAPATPAVYGGPAPPPPVVAPVPQFETEYDTLPHFPPDVEVAAAEFLASPDKWVAVYKEYGFLVVRGLLSPSEVDLVREEQRDVILKWPKNRPPAEPQEVPMVDIDPKVLSGELQPTKPWLCVRRLFRIAVHVPFFTNLARDSRFTSFFRAAFETPCLKLLQSMCLLKPPGTGEKRWHQDNGFFRLTPANLAGGWWVALDDVDTLNGCMIVVPKSHGVMQHHSVPDELDEKQGKTYYCTAKPPTTSACQVPLRQGDAMVFDATLLHYTPPNRTDRQRRALQLHYCAGHCRPTRCDGSRPQGVPDGKVTVATNPVTGPRAERPGFDCDPSTGNCTEPQHWYYRKAELVACGTPPHDPFNEMV
eukprot:Sspe_Gene.64344::Locus_37914_Transcript_1_1_Confidence_1.000_Length_1360::g.64344::m.64344/K00477/PHYH; phytanoyl-CoA hydroxylase